MNSGFEVYDGNRLPPETSVLARLAGWLLGLVGLNPVGLGAFAEGLLAAFRSGLAVTHPVAGQWFATLDAIDPEDNQVAALVRQWSAEAGIQQRQISSEEIIDRCIYALVNEGARILEEGYALGSVDIDIIYLNGYGFPAYRGGPMKYADTVGLKKVYDRISEFHHQHGEWWEPAPHLKHLAEQGKTFAGFKKEHTARA